MCNFDDLNDNAKQLAHDNLMQAITSCGGPNYFLQLLEAVRKTKPHPLMSKNANFRFLLGSIKWEKTIFQDKLDLLMKIRKNEGKTGNLLPEKNTKEYKKVLNMIKTLSPIEFVVSIKDEEGSEGITLKAFDLINEDITRINPIFDMIFFCSIDTTKKIMNYKVQA
jgi:hypothetical protein